MSESNEEVNREKEEDRIIKFFNQAISEAATAYVKNLGETLLHWKGVVVNVTYDPRITHLSVMKGGPIVQAWISIGPGDKDFKRSLYDIAKAAIKLWNPTESVNSHKILHKKGDIIKSRKGEPYFVIPLKYCEVTTIKSVTIKGPDGVSVTVEDKSGLKLDSDLLFEARIKLSALIEWDNNEKEEE